MAAAGGGGDGEGGSSSRRLHVTSTLLDLVAIFDAASGDQVTALRTFGSATRLTLPTAVAVDTVHDELFVANQLINTITVFGWTASGDVAPERTLFGTDVSWPALLAATW